VRLKINTIFHSRKEIDPREMEEEDRMDLERSEVIMGNSFDNL